METSYEVITLHSGRKITNFILKNTRGMQVEVLSLGATLKRVLVPDSEGKFENVILGWQDLNTYEQHPGCLGAVIGRVAGRIYRGEATISGRKYHFSTRPSGNTTHGGNRGFHLQDWEGKLDETENEVSVRLTYFSVDNEEGFPGNLEVSVMYTLNNENELTISYQATTDKETLVNLTNHAYFNLSGEAKRDILDEELYINSEGIYELDNNLIPTGKILPLDEKKCFDFREPKKVGKDINQKDEQLRNGSGYDHIWKLNEGQIAVNLYDSISKRNMKVTTSEPAVVVYTMNHVNQSYVLDNGKPPSRRYAICFETQKPAIGYEEVNKEAVLLKPNQIYRQQTTFSFSLR